MPDVKVHIAFQPKQSKVWFLLDRSKFTRIGFGGARGGAKSGGLRRILLLFLLTYAKTKGLLLRRTYPELYKSHIVKLFEEYPQLRQFWREQQKELALPNGSKLFFGSAPHPGDMADYYSAEFDIIGMDEAQEFGQQEIENLSGSCRTVLPGVTPAMLFTFMPGVSESGMPPIGLNYLKRIFVDNIQRGDESRQRWTFMQAFAWDNVEWARRELEKDGVTEGQFNRWPNDKRRDYFIARTEFGATLSALTNTALRDAWLFGKWGVFQGQYFPQFNYDRHTVDFASIRLEPWHKYWISGDWGYDHPACYYLHMQDEKGKVYTLKELWGREMNEEVQGGNIGLLRDSVICSDRTSPRLSEFWLSWDAFGKLNKFTRRSVVEMISAALPRNFPKPQPADATSGSRISGWRLMSKMLDAGMWVISRDCEKLIQCLPTLMRDMERNTEDVLKVDWSTEQLGDDPADAARYGLQNMIDATTVPGPVQVERKLQECIDDGRLSLSNPTAIMMWRKTMELRAQTKAQRTPFAYKWLRSRGGHGSGIHPLHGS